MFPQPQLENIYYMEAIKLKDIIEKALDVNKARDVVVIDLKRKKYIADHMIIDTSTYSRHIQSLSEIIVRKLEEFGILNCKVEGKDSPHWKLVDAADIIVHIFHPEKRSFYDLEKMWSENIPKEKAII